MHMELNGDLITCYFNNQQVFAAQGGAYANGQAGSIYKQAMPRVNASRAPGQWQAYDILWKAPRFSAGGGLISPARITVLHNGVLVQDDTVLAGKTEYIGAPSYSPHACAPL